MNCRASIFPSQETARVSPLFASGRWFLHVIELDTGQPGILLENEKERWMRGQKNIAKQL
jgi:hypothetical protein